MFLTSEQKKIVRLFLTTSKLNDYDSMLLLNTVISPAYWVWKARTTRGEIQDAQGFDWTCINNLSVGKARVWDNVFDAVDYIEPWKGNHRLAINSVWADSKADLAMRAAIISVCQRPVTNFEKLFVVQTTDGPAQTGNRGSVTNPDKLGVDTRGNLIEGVVSEQFVSDIRGGL
jgi:hypothetical protein